MWYPTDDFAGVGQDIFCLKECDAVGDFDDLCLFWVYKEPHVSSNALDVFAQLFKILFVGMQDDTVIHIRIMRPVGICVTANIYHDGRICPHSLLW